MVSVFYEHFTWPPCLVGNVFFSYSHGMVLVGEGRVPRLEQDSYEQVWVKGEQKNKELDSWNIPIPNKIIVYCIWDAAMQGQPRKKGEERIEALGKISKGWKGKRSRIRKKRGLVKKAENTITMRKKFLIIVFPPWKCQVFPKCKEENVKKKEIN